MHKLFVLLVLLLVCAFPVLATMNASLTISQTDATYIKGIPIQDTTGRSVAENWGWVLNSTLDSLVVADLSGATLGSSISSSELADGDWGDVSISSGVASVEDFTISGETQGDILIFNGTNWVKLAKGAAKQVLKMNAGETAPEWATDSVGSGGIADLETLFGYFDRTYFDTLVNAEGDSIIVVYADSTNISLKAIQDGSGNTITSTYAPITTPTFTTSFGIGTTTITEAELAALDSVAGVDGLAIAGQTAGDILCFYNGSWHLVSAGTAGQVLEMQTGDTTVGWGTDDGAGAASIENDTYSSGWDGDIINGASQNAIYDYLHQLDTDDDGAVDVIDIGVIDTVNFNQTQTDRYVELIVNGYIDTTTLDTIEYAYKAVSDLSGNVITTTYAPLASPTFTGTPTIPTPFTLGAVSVTADAGELNVLDGIPGTLTATELGYVDGVTSSIQSQLDGQDEIDELGAGNWKVFYSNGSGVITELGLGSDGTYLRSNGASAAPTFDTPSGSGLTYFTEGDDADTSTFTPAASNTVIGFTSPVTMQGNSIDGVQHVVVDTVFADVYLTTGDASGSITFEGATSGSTTWGVLDIAGTLVTTYFPTVDGAQNQFLMSDSGAGTDSLRWATIDFSFISGEVADTQIADGAVDGGSGGEIADHTIDANDIKWTSTPGSGEDNYLVSYDYASESFTAVAAGSGEANTVSNQGAGYKLYEQKVTYDLQFKTITAGTGISLDTATANQLNISVSSIDSTLFNQTQTDAYVNLLVNNYIDTTTLDTIEYAHKSIADGSGNVITTTYAPLASPTFTGTPTIPTPFTLGAVSVTADAGELNVLDGIPGTLTATELGYVDGVTSSIQSQLDGQDEIDELGAGNWKVFYSNGSGVITELGLGSDGTYLRSNGASAAPTFDTPSSSGEANTASNQGAGFKIFEQKTSIDLEFKTFTGGAGITLDTNTANQLNIVAEVTQAELDAKIDSADVANLSGFSFLTTLDTVQAIGTADSAFIRFINEGDSVIRVTSPIGATFSFEGAGDWTTIPNLSSDTVFPAVLDMSGGKLLSDNNTLEVYDGTRSVLIPLYSPLQVSVPSPDLLNDTITIFQINTTLYPYGITLLELELVTNDSSATYSVQLEEWTGKKTRSRANYIDTIATAADSSYTKSTTFTTSSLSAGNQIRAIFPATENDDVFLSIVYFVNKEE